MNIDNKKIAIVVQRCGIDIMGGAELYALNFAKSLAEQNFQVEILTSKSDDYLKWNNELQDEEWVQTNGRSFCIKRFPVSHGRLRIIFAIIKRINFFISSHFWKIYKFMSPLLDYIFLRSQGPWCPKLWNYLKKNSEQYSLLIVKSYLYSSNYYSLMNLSNKVTSIFIVTAHNEPEFKLNFVSKALTKSTILGFVSNAEKELCNNIWEISRNKNSIILPPGIDKNVNIKEEIRKNIYDLLNKKYFIYIGRIDKNKNINFIFENTPKECLVIFAGDLKYDIPNDHRFIYIGRVSEVEKIFLLKHAIAFVIASRFEAFSIVTAEAILNGCIVLALEGCAPIDELIYKYGGIICTKSNFKYTMVQLWENRYDGNFIPIQNEKIDIEKSWKNNVSIVKNLLNNIN